MNANRGALAVCDTNSTQQRPAGKLTHFGLKLLLILMRGEWGCGGHSGTGLTARRASRTQLRRDHMLLMPQWLHWVAGSAYIDREALAGQKHCGCRPSRASSHHHSLLAHIQGGHSLW